MSYRRYKNFQVFLDRPATTINPYHNLTQTKNVPTPLPEDDRTTTTFENATSDEHKTVLNQRNHMSTELIAGIIIGALVALIFCIINLIMIKRKRKSKEKITNPSKKGKK